MPLKTVLPDKDRHINVWRPTVLADVDACGRFLRKARIMRKLSQRRVALAAKVAQSAISHYETNAGHDWRPTSWLSVPVFLRIVHALGYQLVLVPRQDAMPNVARLDVEGPEDIYEGTQS